MYKEYLKKHKTAFLVVLVVAVFAVAALLYTRTAGVDLGSMLKGNIKVLKVDPFMKKATPYEKKAIAPNVAPVAAPAASAPLAAPAASAPLAAPAASAPLAAPAASAPAAAPELMPARKY